MSIPTSIICRHNKTWFDILSMDQLKDLCRASTISHINKNKLDMIVALCENEISSSLASVTVASIQDMCRSRSLAITGLKYQLVLRVLVHDCLKKSAANESRVSVECVRKKMEDGFESGSNVYCWLEDKMAKIRYGTLDSHGHELSQCVSVSGHRTPISAFRDAESIISFLIDSCIPNGGTDDADSLSKVIDHLAIIIVEARLFLSNSEKKAAVAWILKLDNFLSEYMLGENSKTSMKDLVQLLENAAYHLPKSVPTPKETKKKQYDNKPMRTPLRCLKNDAKKGPNKAIVVAAVANKKPKPKVVTSKKEIVYKKMASFVRTPGVDSDYVYERLVRQLKSILSQFDDYEALGLFRSVFLALIVHFEKIEHPGRDIDHSFTIAIDMLGNVVEAVVEVLSIKEKKETLRWMTDLNTLTRPHALGEIAEVSLDELICMVKESKSKAGEQETKPRRFFFS